jgi:hypothetical protein
MMRPGSRLAVRLLLAASLSVVEPSAAAPARVTIAVGEVSAKVAGVDPRTESFMRELVSREVERLRLQGGRSDGYVLSASLVRFDASREREGCRATSEVSAILRRSSDGAILAVMRGRGRAEGGRDDLWETRSAALEAAVRGAVRHVPEAL